MDKLLTSILDLVTRCKAQLSLVHPSSKSQGALNQAEQYLDQTVTLINAQPPAPKPVTAPVPAPAPVPVPPVPPAPAPAPVPVPAPAPAPAPVPAPVPGPAPAREGRVTTLTHLGSFKVPAIAGPDAGGFAYGGQALSYNKANNSLFVAGFNAPPSGGQRLGEISIPAFGATAKILQTPADPAEGTASKVGPNSVLLGGTLPWNNALIFTEYLYYDGANQQVLTHFSRSLALKTKGVTGPYRVGPLEGGLYSGYLGVVDPAWVDRFGGPALTGNADLGVISRTSFGPCAFAFDPASPDETAKALVYYDDKHQSLGPWGGSNPLYGGADTMKGVVMPFGTGSVLFFGTHGTTFCYGPGTTDKAKAGTKDPAVDPVDAFCYDPDSQSKGVHGYPYIPQCWLYDADDLAKVAAGTTHPWDVKPYLTLQIPDMGPKVGGAAYDPDGGRIFVSELGGAGNNIPSIHVYQVG